MEGFKSRDNKHNVTMRPAYVMHSYASHGPPYPLDSASLAQGRRLKAQGMNGRRSTIFFTPPRSHFLIVACHF